MTFLRTPDEDNLERLTEKLFFDDINKILFVYRQPSESDMQNEKYKKSHAICDEQWVWNLDVKSISSEPAKPSEQSPSLL